MRKVDLKSLLGSAIKSHRNGLGISQEELASRAGLHRTYVADVERGARNLSLESIDRLASALQISISGLFARVNAAAREGTGADTTVVGSGEMVDILLVEDDPHDVELTIAAFDRARISNRLQVVRDGAEALEFLFREGKYAHRQQEDHPKVILLDLNLPKVSGLEVLHRIKADPSTRSIPVIMLTVSNRDHDIAECRRLGAETYLVKPVDFHRFSEVTPKFSLRWALIKPAPEQPVA
jgi:CheY-like chemotaxis protein